MSVSDTPHPRTSSYGRILGVGGYRPRTVIDNAELCRTLDSTPEWIETRSGIRERRFAAPDETLEQMAVAASGKALAQAGIGPEDLDFVLIATMTNLRHAPPLSARIARSLGADRAAALDTSAACSGFCHTLAIASDMVSAGSARHVLVIGADRMTDIVQRTDRGSAFLFADGAGAVVVGPSDEPGFGPVVRRTDSRYVDSVWMTAPWSEGGERPWLRIDGRRIFRWAMDEVAPAAEEMLRVAGVAPDRLGTFVPHQANVRMIELMADRLGLGPETVVARDVVHTGNTSAASVPLALDAVLAEGRVGRGDTALLIGFGAGLSFAGQVVVLP
ncbi:MAG: ketoacyl-ACP synthase III [Streptomyces sp.]|nr:ketoacyl-ACP synthase III [Streptomyces sp.]NUR38895.1 ketoacyl-ACP synthase III [Streptomyces sp.]NUR66021.1 ketoacyl-ACP synthase III [Streptomyces sp.]NUS29952.1 ketoacyl-ACP synthase III [Streptomyces sp.]NUS79365.1 ketoacyl-ACP synthase III [Streptomyces sp.]